MPTPPPPLSLASRPVQIMLGVFCALIFVALGVGAGALHIMLNASAPPRAGLQAGNYKAGDGLALSAAGSLSLAPIASRALLGNDDAGKPAPPTAVGPLAEGALVVGGGTSFPNNGADGTLLSVSASGALQWKPAAAVGGRSFGVYALPLDKISNVTGVLATIATTPGIVYVVTEPIDASRERPLWALRVVLNFPFAAHNVAGTASLLLDDVLPEGYEQVFPSSVNQGAIVAGVGWCVTPGHHVVDADGSADVAPNRLDISCTLRGTSGAGTCYCTLTVTMALRPK